MKQGFAKSGKKYYSDFMFSNENTEFIEWMEKIETFCQDTIYNVLTGLKIKWIWVILKTISLVH